MRRLRRLFTTVTLLLAIVLVIPLTSDAGTVYALEPNEIDVDVYQDNLLDVYLTVGETDTDLGNFENDLKASLIGKGVPEDHINIKAIETAVTSTNSADAGAIFSEWERYNDVGDWQYDSDSYNIVKTTNAPWSGFYDPGFNSSDYTLELEMETTDSDDDDMGITFGMNGFTNSLNADETGFAFVFGGYNGWYGPDDWKQDSTQSITQNSHATGLYSINGTNLVALQGQADVCFSTNVWYKFKLVVKGDKIKLYKADSQGNYPDLPLIDYVADHEVKGTWGFFANSQPYAKFRNVQMTSNSTRSFSEVIREPDWRPESSRFIVNATDIAVPDFSDDVALGEILSRLGNEDISYIGWGYDDYDGNSFIAKNNGEGVYIDKDSSAYDSYAKQIQGIADYIYSKYYDSINNDTEYLIYGKPNSISVSPQTIQAGTADEEWPDGRWLIDHDPDYFENSTGTVPYDNKRLTDLDITFTETGKYDIYYENDLVKTIYVHRAPISGFSVNLGSGVTISDNSYDPDYQSSADPLHGIATVQYSYKETSSDTWTEGLPSVLESNQNLIIRQVTSDNYGVISTPYYRYVSTESATPMAEFTVTPSLMLKYNNQTTLVYNDTSYDPKGVAITERFWKVIHNGTEDYSGSVPKTDFSANDTGKYQIILAVKNANGIWSETVSRFVTLVDDSISPNAVSDTPSGTYYSSLVNNMTFFDEENGSGFSHRYIVISSDSVTPANWGSISTNRNYSLLMDKTGTYYIHYKALDYAGNEKVSYFGPYTLIDNEKPADAVISTTPDYNFGEWSNQDIAVSFTSSDNMTSNENLEYSYSFNGESYLPGNSLVLDENGSRTVYFKACDESGLCSVVSRNFKIDKTSPSVPYTGMTSDGETYEAGTWANSLVSVSLSGSTDNLTYSPEYQYKIDDGEWTSGSGYEITASGIYTIYSRTVDNAGNCSDVDTKTVKIDTVLPSDAVISTTPDYSYGEWSNHDIAVSFGDSSDNLTDPEDIEYSYSFDGNSYTTGDKLVLDEDGIYDVYFKACDESGLCSVVSRNFKIDKTQPDNAGYSYDR